MDVEEKIDILVYGTREQKSKLERELRQVQNENRLEIRTRQDKIKQMQNEMNIIAQYEQQKQFDGINYYKSD